MKNIWRLLRLLPSFSSRVVRVAVINIIIGAIVAITPYLIKVLLDKVIIAVSSPELADYSQITLYVSLIVGVRLAEGITHFFQERTSDVFFLQVMTNLRQRVFKHLLELSIDFYEANRIGEVIQKVGAGVTELARWVSRVFEGMLETLVSLTFMLVLLWIVAPPVGLIMSIIFPLNLFLARYLAKRVQPIRKEWLRYGEQAGGELTEALTHIATVRSFGQEEYKRQRHSELNFHFGEFRLKQFSMEWKMNLLRNVLNTAAIGAALILITNAALNGSNTVGDIFLVALYIQRMISNIVPLSRLISDTADVETTCERLVEILENKQSIQDLPNATELKKIEAIEFKNVSFSYPGKEIATLKSISFQLGHGQTMALVGPSGVGKTTITKLLLRFYAPTSGQILINGQPVESFTQDSIRQKIGMVMQDVALFNDTVEENIKFARPAASTKEIVAAAATAHADAFIDKLPEGYKTLVGERGIKLSGGEKQRVAIARAILKDPQLVILDEATSALDSQSERFVQDGLHQLLQDKTAVIIAHRLSTVMRADIIVVLKDGSVLEQGSHAELLKKQGLYSKLFSMQSDSLKELELTA